MVQLDGYTVGYAEAVHGMCEMGLDVHGMCEKEMVQLDGYTVDYAEAVHGMCERGRRKLYN